MSLPGIVLSQYHIIKWKQKKTYRVPRGVYEKRWKRTVNTEKQQRINSVIYLRNRWLQVRFKRYQMTWLYARVWKKSYQYINKTYLKEVYFVAYNKEGQNATQKK